MASNAQTTAQLQHLRQASHALATTAPQISAHLMSRYLSLLPPGKNADAERSTICFACGTIRTPGDVPPAQAAAAAAVLEQGRKQERDINGETISFVCTACHKITTTFTEPARTTKLSPKEAAQKSTEFKAVNVAATSKSVDQSTTTTTTTTQSSSSSSQSSRKRAKKGLSLSKMLAAQKKDSTPGGFGLDLMDLLKTA
ncbi:hypothetical protein FN846DRAFT_964505 [Sphaerosporella brunnea]|uniref:RNAse P Rpr2/Rpp21/SNM1 subunit domain-containing protein n=1 Tax=Sphaerosporella brunnea TaxID=1250544 RepID=A0A5J5EN67_9PEZI|nr:hypothetical protein FN846DRAFT_964505 [Sphaerosporella brunnea]